MEACLFAVRRTLSDMSASSPVAGSDSTCRQQSKKNHLGHEELGVLLKAGIYGERHQPRNS